MGDGRGRATGEAACTGSARSPRSRNQASPVLLNVCLHRFDYQWFSRSHRRPRIRIRHEDSASRSRARNQGEESVRLTWPAPARLDVRTDRMMSAAVVTDHVAKASVPKNFGPSSKIRIIRSGPCPHKNVSAPRESAKHQPANARISQRVRRSSDHEETTHKPLRTASAARTPSLLTGMIEGNTFECKRNRSSASRTPKTKAAPRNVACAPRR